ncbi:MAG: hypothetical protein AMXMBFR7_39290 [Planctomycetota bacterium]
MSFDLLEWTYMAASSCRLCGTSLGGSERIRRDAGSASDNAGLCAKCAGAVEAESRFYFCEKCGKRITQGDLTRGEGRDKKVMGVFCRECAETVLTVEFSALSQASALEIIKANESQRQDAPTSEMPSLAAPKKRPTSKIRPASSSSSARISRREIAGARAQDGSTAWMAMGSIGAGIGISILLLLAFSDGPTPNPRRSAENRAELPREPRAAPAVEPAQTPAPPRTPPETEAAVHRPLPESTATGAVSVTLQDGLEGYSGTRDTYLDEDKSITSRGRSDGLLSVIAPGNKPMRTTLIRFAIFQSEGGSVPDGAHVESATLSLYLKESSTLGIEIAPSRVLRRWKEHEANAIHAAAGVHWSKPLAQEMGTDIAPPVDPQHRCPNKAGWFHLNVTESVRAFASGIANDGWLLYSKDPRYNTKTFLSREAKDADKRPKLVIIFRPK